MKFLSYSFVTALASFTFVNGAVQLPSDDSFYTPPSGYESQPLGAILKSREVPSPLEGLDYSKAYQILYRTSTASGDAEADATTIIVPNGDTKNVLLSYQIPEDAAWVGCAPSYSLLTSNGSADLQAILDNGWYLNVPDYEGPLSSFTAGIHSGYSTLDSIKAALASGDDTGISGDVKVGLWGYSGGSIASGWASQLQNSYAPDLKIDATAVGGFVINITASALMVNDGFYAGFVPGGIIGLATQYPDFSAALNQYLVPSTAEKFYEANSTCVLQDLINYISEDIFSYFSNDEGILSVPAIAKVLNDNTLALDGSIPGSPLYIYQGVKDQIAPVGEVDKAVSRYCAAGASSIEYLKDPDTDHTGTEAAADEYAFDWLKEVLDNNSKPVAGCTTITTAFGPASSSGAATTGVSSSAVANTTSSSGSNFTISSSLTSGSPTVITSGGASSFTTITTVTTVTEPCLTSGGSTYYTTAAETITVTIPCSKGTCKPVPTATGSAEGPGSGSEGGSTSGTESGAGAETIAQTGAAASVSPISVLAISILVGVTIQLL